MRCNAENGLCQIRTAYDINKHLFNAKGIRPRISYIGHIYTCADIVSISDYNEHKKVKNLSIQTQGIGIGY